MKVIKSIIAIDGLEHKMLVIGFISFKIIQNKMMSCSNHINIKINFKEIEREVMFIFQ